MMEVKYALTTIALFVATTLIATSEAQCNSTKLDECLQTYSNVTRELGEFSVNSTDVMTDRCNSYDKLVSCVSTTTGCKDTDRDILIKWLGMRQALGYICKDGRSDYLRHAPCLTNSSFTNALMTNCSKYQDSMYKNPVQHNLQAEFSCREYSDALRCKQTIAQQYCGNAARDFVRRYSVQMLEPPVKFVAPSCTGMCNGMELDKCVKDFEPYSSNITNGGLNEAALNEACSLRVKAADCIKQKTGCTDEDTITQMIWTGPSKTTEYLCGQGKTAYLQSRACLANTTTSRGDQCKSSSTPPPTASMADKLKFTCQYMVNWIQCNNNVTEKACGKVAADLVAKLAPNFAAPALKAADPSCNVPGVGFGNSAMTLLGSTLVLLTSLLLSSIA